MTLSYPGIAYAVLFVSNKENTANSCYDIPHIQRKAWQSKKLKSGLVT